MTITLRNLPPQVAEAVRRRAEEQNTSMNKAVISLLERALGPVAEDETDSVCSDLDKFAGTWTSEHADAFDKALWEQRRIDPGLW